MYLICFSKSMIHQYTRFYKYSVARIFKLKPKKIVDVYSRVDWSILTENRANFTLLVCLIEFDCA